MLSLVPVRSLARRATWVAFLGLALPGLALPGVGWRGLGGSAETVCADEAPVGQAPDAKTREEIVRVVEELRIEASKIRGLAWKHDVPADLLSRDQLKKQLEAMIKEDIKPDEYERDNKILRRLGMLTAEEDPIELMKRFLEQGIAGFYNPKTKRLYIIDGLSVEGQRPTMLHELIHALEDQYIDLEAMQKSVEKDSDALFAMKCATEGSAERARRLYEKAHPDVAKRAQHDQMKSQNMDAMAATLKATPAYLFVPALLHYQLGPALVSRYVGADYPGGMARIYAGDSPKTQEQCVHPGRFVAADRDLPRGIGWPAKLESAAGAGWKGLEPQVTGELDFTLWMSRWLGHNGGRLATADSSSGRMWAKEAGVAAEGWDGMKVQVFEKDGVPTGVALASAWDTHKDAVEAADAIEASLRAQFEGNFRAEAWADAPDARGASTKSGAEGRKGRVLDFADRFGTGRLLVRDDIVLLLDGFPGETLSATWALLEATTFSRDPKDTWTAAKAPDVLASAAWRGDGVGWSLPDEMWLADSEAPGSFTKGELSLRFAAERGSIQEIVMKQLVDVKRKSPKATIDPNSLIEFTLGGKTTLRMDYDVPGADGAHTTSNSLIFILSTGTALVVRAGGPKSEWGKLERDVDEALDAILWND